MRKKELLARFLKAAGGMRVATSLRGRYTQELVVLAYHRVLPVLPTDDYPFDLELISADVEQFDWQMSWISKNFQPLSVSEIVDCIDRGKPVPAGSVAVTFDDGFSDNYTHAYPVLRSRGIPACIFLSTDFIGTVRPYWFEAVAQVLMVAPVETIHLPAIPSPLPAGDKRATRRDDIARVLSEFKKLPDEARQTNLDYLERHAGSLIDGSVGFGAHAMSWPQVEEMSRYGIEFGSHGTSHAVLSRLNAVELARELTDSRRTIETVTGKPVVAIAYPVGGVESINYRVITAAADAGYRIGFTYLRGANDRKLNDRMRLNRQHVERFVGRAYFQGLLAFPSVFD